MRFDVPVSVFVSVCPSLLNPLVCGAHLHHIWIYLKLLKEAFIFVLTLAAPVDRRGKITTGSCSKDLGLATACICFDCEWRIDTTCTSSKEIIFSPVSICWLVGWFVPINSWHVSKRTKSRKDRSGMFFSLSISS